MMRWARSLINAIMRRATIPLRRVAGVVIDCFPHVTPHVAQWSWLWQPGWGRRHHERFYESGPDPYGFESPEEQAKYLETLSLLDDVRYARALEVGAGEGLFTEMLLPYCDALVAVEVSEVALSRAEARIGDVPGLSLERRTFPLDLPEGTFDLIVVSDVAYFWTPEVLDRGLALIAERLRPGGRLLLLHYRGLFGAPVTGDYVHDRALAVARHSGFDVRGDLEFSHRGPHDSGYRVDLITRPGAGGEPVQS